MEVGKIWSEVKELLLTGSGGSAPEGATGINYVLCTMNYIALKQI
jgi:hypothetical protein